MSLVACLTDSGTWTGLPVVTDVCVSTSSAVGEMCEDVSSDPDWEFVGPQSFLSAKKRPFSCLENPGEMIYEGMAVKAPPCTRRRIMPPTPQQNTHSSANEKQWQVDLEAQRSIWSTRERTAVAGTENYLELLMDPEDSEVCLRYILTHARRRGRDGNGKDGAVREQQ